MVYKSDTPTVNVANEKPKRSKKKKKQIYLTEMFYNQLEDITKLLFETQPERKILKRLIPYPYSAGDEIEFRYNAYDDMRLICFEIINQLPYKKRLELINKIPDSPLQKIIKEFEIEIPEKK